MTWGDKCISLDYSSIPDLDVLRIFNMLTHCDKDYLPSFTFASSLMMYDNSVLRAKLNFPFYCINFYFNILHTRFCSIRRWEQ